MQKIVILFSFFALFSCSGGNGSTTNVTISGEASGKYENNSSSSYTKTVNGKVVEEVKSNNHSGGGFETDFNVVIGNGDTTITKEETPTLNPKITCTQTLADSDIEQLKTAILRNTLDKNRILTAKIAINDWCLSSNQTRDVLALFTMDKYRLDFAKFAYGHTTDRINFGRVKDAFSFEDSKQKLDNYINTL